MRNLRRHRGVVLTTEVLTALAIVTAMALLLSVTMGRSRAAAVHLAASRSAVRLAERTALELQLHQPMTPPLNTVRMMRLAQPAPARGMAWVEIQCKVDDRSATLVALVPAAGASDSTAGAKR